MLEGRLCIGHHRSENSARPAGSPTTKSFAKLEENKMAKVKLNPILENMHGHVGDLVFKRYGDEVIIASKADADGRVYSAAQLSQQKRFREAALFGRGVMADPDTKAVYAAAARAKGVPLFSLTIADFFHAPTVEEVDLSEYSGHSGDSIIVHALDDFAVTGVHVALAQVNGAAIESGEAEETPVNSGRWLYKATTNVNAGVEVQVTATATDRPGGVGTRQGQKTV
jgi:hypothetical protein